MNHQCGKMFMTHYRTAHKVLIEKELSFTKDRQTHECTYMAMPEMMVIRIGTELGGKG